MKILRTSMLLALLSSSWAYADLTEQLEVCAAMSDAEARLACFDAIGREESAKAGKASRPAPAPASTPEPTPAALPAAAPTPATLSGPAPTSVPEEPAPQAVPAVDEPGKNSMSERERKRLEREARAAEKAAEKAARQAEKERKKSEKKQPVVARIVAVRQHHDGRFSVTLDNGEVWRETQGSKVGLPAEGARVELTRGSLGGYRMKIDGLYRTAWVKRSD